MSHGIRYDEMLMLLKGRGINVDTFDQVSRKTLRQLHEEIEERDVVLGYDKKLGRVIRTALSVKVLIIAEGFQLLEIKREHRDGTVIEKLKQWSISETRKRGELVFDAAVRGLSEECGLTVRPEELTEIRELREMNIHESSAYAGLMSAEFTDYVTLKLEKMPWQGDRVTTDHSVKIYTRWFKP